MKYALQIKKFGFNDNLRRTTPGIFKELKIEIKAQELSNCSYQLDYSGKDKSICRYI